MFFESEMEASPEPTPVAKKPAAKSKAASAGSRVLKRPASKAVKRPAAVVEKEPSPADGEMEEEECKTVDEEVESGWKLLVGIIGSVGYGFKRFTLLLKISSHKLQRFFGGLAGKRCCP